MKTKIVKYTRDNKEITIIGCCHIGTEKYYSNLQDEISKFENTQVVYEGVTSAVKNDKLTQLYKLLSEATGLKYQKDEINYNKEWINADVDIELINSVNGSPIMKQFDDIDINKIKNLKEINRKFLMFIFNMILFFNKFLKFDIKKNSNFLDLRNYKCIMTLFGVLKTEDKVCVIYGDDHIKGIGRYLKKVGFERIYVKYLNPLK